jgi:hypothetical protein
MRTKTDKEHKPLTGAERADYLDRCAGRRARLADARRLLMEAAEQIGKALEHSEPATDEAAMEFGPDNARALLASPADQADAGQAARYYLAEAQRRAAQAEREQARSALVDTARTLGLRATRRAGHAALWWIGLVALASPALVGMAALLRLMWIAGGAQ